MKLKTLFLSEHDRQQLQHIARRSDDWRERERAQTILYLADGWRAKAIAAEQNLHLDTVYDRRQRWLVSGFASLYLPSLGGAPAKLTENHRALLQQWATEEALSVPQLQVKLLETCQIKVHENTLRRALRQMNFVWKRTRHSLKKNETK